MTGAIINELQSRFVLFSCEGTAEAVVIEKLFESGMLIVPDDRVVKDPKTFKPFTRLRKAKDIEGRFLMQNYATAGCDGLMIARVVDSRSASFKLSAIHKDDVLVRSFITAPEIEMLIIHAEGMYDDWLRKSRMDRQLRPSDYCKRNLGLASVKERNFLAGYWANTDKLIASIRSYAGKRGKRKSGELMLVDLIS